MKKKKILALLICGFLSKNILAQKITVSVNGMVCGFCAQGISKKFKNLPEIQDLKVSLENKEVVINLKEQSKLDDQKINDLLKEAGFNVVKIVRE